MRVHTSVCMTSIAVVASSSGRPMLGSRPPVSATGTAMREATCSTQHHQLRLYRLAHVMKLLLRASVDAKLRSDGCVALNSAAVLLSAAATAASTAAVRCDRLCTRLSMSSWHTLCRGGPYMERADRAGIRPWAAGGNTAKTVKYCTTHRMEDAIENDCTRLSRRAAGLAKSMHLPGQRPQPAHLQSSEPYHADDCGSEAHEERKVCNTACRHHF